MSRYLAVKSVDGAPTFTGKYRSGASAMRGMTAARCSQRLKTQKRAGDLIDLPLSKGTEVSQ